LAFSPVHWGLSALARTDAPVVLFTALSLLAALSTLHNPGWSRFALAGTAAGLAMSSKYYGIIALAGLPLAQLLGWEGRGGRRLPKVPTSWWGKLLLGLTCAGVAFAATSPFVLLDARTAWQSIAQEQQGGRLGADGLPPWGNLWWYLTTALPRALGWPVAALFVLGVWQALRHRRGGALVLLGFAGVFTLLVSLQALHWDRWLAPILPGVCAVAALGLQWGAGAVYALLARRVSRQAVSLLLLCVALLGPMARCVEGAIERTLPDTRLLTRAWIQEHLPAGATLATEAYTAPLDGTPLQVMEVGVLAEHSLDFYCQSSVQYVGTSDAMYSRYAAEPERYAEQLLFYRRLRESAELVHRESPVCWRVAGPTVSIYRLVGCDTE
ncbi:MAG TPA: glycosyltransferase family 39 protein, partial [Anaerolineae bacterium]|nr:glycosyltransferase family 39 protein [Anaerolineae bacterium]